MSTIGALEHELTISIGFLQKQQTQIIWYQGGTKQSQVSDMMEKNTISMGKVMYLRLLRIKAQHKKEMDTLHQQVTKHQQRLNLVVIDSFYVWM